MVRENESVYIPLGEVHRMANPGKILLELIEVQTGSYLGEDDIIRLDDEFGTKLKPKLDRLTRRRAMARRFHFVHQRDARSIGQSALLSLVALHTIALGTATAARRCEPGIRKHNVDQSKHLSPDALQV